jgi:hypothetical protein
MSAEAKALLGQVVCNDPEGCFRLACNSYGGFGEDTYTFA